MTPPGKDTRRHPRFSVDVEALVHASNGRNLPARTRDLSRSGICLITSTALKGGEPVVIELVLAFGENAFSEPLRLEARVVWCTAIGQSFQVGAMFTALSDDDEQFLEMFLRYLDGSLTPAELAGAGGGGSEEWEEKEPTPPPDVKDDPFRH
jgi:hypothetical protein